MAEITTRRRPSNLLSMRDEFDQLLNRFFEGWPTSTEGTWVPLVDVAETDNEVVVKVEVPGVKSEDLDVSVRDNNLVISGQKKESAENRRENYYHIERRYGAFYRSIPLSASVDADKVDATCHEGVLTIRIPKTEQAKPRKVKVKEE